VNVIIRNYRSNSTDAEKIQKISQICFSSGLWKTPGRTPEEMERRWEDHSSQTGFSCLVGEVDQQIIAASWYFEITLDQLAEKRGNELRDFVKSISRQDISLVWLGETFVHPDFQRRGYARQIKERVMDEVRDSLAPAILLTRMRPDNAFIISTNKKLGFRPTGISVLSKTKPGVFHEYWYMFL